jgi:hypothetical protein
MKTKNWLIGVAIAALTTVSEAQVRNLIVNGSFESPGVPGSPVISVLELLPGSTEIPGWVVGENGAYWLSLLFPDPRVRPADGEYLMDLSSIFGDTRNASISQVISTRPGFTYRLSFQMAGENANVPAPAVLRVTIGGEPCEDEDDEDCGELHEFALPTTSTVRWVEQSLVFTAKSETTAINFADFKFWPDGGSNTLLDSVSVVLDPEANTIQRLVPCEGPLEGGTWRSHGEYVSAVVEAVKTLLIEGLMNEEAARAMMKAAANSGCGKN